MWEYIFRTISNLAVTVICYECGFENLSWFYKRFIARFGMPPKKYRENHLSEISQQDNELSR